MPHPGGSGRKRTSGAWRHRRRAARRTVVGLLVALFSVAAVASTIGVWARRTVLRTEPFVQTVKPLSRDEAVARALSSYLTDLLLTEIDLDRRVARGLPDDLEFLVGPLDAIVRDYTADAVRDVLRRDAFERFWVDTVRRSHQAAVAILDGDAPEGVTVEDGEVTLDLLPVVHEALQRVIARGPGLLGDVELPDLPDNATRREIRRAIEDTLGIELPRNFGQIVVFDEDRLSEAQDAVHLANRFVVILLAAVLVTGGAALALSVDRRRTLLQLGLGTAITTYLVFVVVRRVVADLVDLVPEGQNRDAARASARIVSDGLRERAWLVLVAGLVVAAGAYLAGPGRVAVLVRRRVRDAWTWFRQGAPGLPLPKGAEFGDNLDRLRIGVVVVGFAALLFFDASWLGLFVVIGLVGAVELVLMSVKARARA